MNRKVQIYIQTDKIDENFCSCVVITLDDIPYQAGSISSTGEGYNIYEFYLGEYHYFIVYELAGGSAGLGDNAWVLYRDAIGDRVEGYTFDIGTHCPVSDNWHTETFRSIVTESCSVNKQYYERLDLFDDEKIVINSSVQNVSDIASVHSDYSQSFVVPASTHNNQILEHWYNSDVNSLQDNRIRRKARIEIDHIPFKTGNLQLEKANIKNKRIESYTLQFFGDLVSLKDTLGEASLNTLDLSAYSFEYNLANVSDLVSFDFDSAIKFPLITSKNLWSYGDGGTYDITDPAKAFYFTELFPAIKVKELFNTIENQFGITFTSDFLSNDRFTNLFLWLKNQEIKVEGTQPYIGYTNTTTVLDFTNTTDSVIFDLDNNILNIVDFNNNGFKYQYGLSIDVASTSSASNYYIQIFKNGTLLSTITGSGDYYFGSAISYQVADFGDQYTFKAWSETSMSFDFNVGLSVNIAGLFYPLYFGWGNITTPSLINLNQFLPDIKITDFISGILKQFNLTCVPTSDTNYIIEPLDTWYSEGNIYDITEYTDTESIDVERVQLYKAIKFVHQQSESFINRQFYAFNGYEYGDIKIDLGFDGSEYNIELPFENLLFQRFSASKVQVGYCINNSFNDYVPKPILLYKYLWQNTDVDMNITDGATTFNLTSYQPFGQDVRYGSQDISLNFRNDLSTLLDKYMDNNSYSLYYQSYLLNLYNKKNRITTIKTNLPLSILTRLKLNDRLVIRDKRYIINDYQADLTSGDVQFKLLNDFRFIDTLNWQNDPEQYPNVAG